MEFCDTMLNRSNTNPNYSTKQFFLMRYWSDKNPNWIVEAHMQYPQKITGKTLASKIKNNNDTQIKTTYYFMFEETTAVKIRNTIFRLKNNKTVASSYILN